MDPQREFAVLKYVTAIWNRNVTDMLDLKNGHFFLHVLDLLNHCNKDRITDTDENRLLFVKEFFQDFYNDSVRMDDYLNFNIILRGQTSSLTQIKLELAKIAVVLFGIGVLNKNRNVFMKAALQLPAELQNDILELIQSVVLPDSAEVVLTDRIEQVLLAADISRPPVFNILTAETYSMNSRSQTPCTKFAHRPQIRYDNQTPKRTGESVFSPFHDISSPFRHLDISSPSSVSPLIDFIQSPQLIQKAVLKQKDMELQKLQEQLDAETLLKEEAEYSLRECQLLRANLDCQISKLQKRILEFEGMQESNPEVLQLQKKNQEVTAELLSVKEYVQDLLAQKYMLEKENAIQTEDNSELHRKIKSLATESVKHKNLLQRVKILESDNKSQEVQLMHLRKSQTQWETEKAAYNRNSKTAREIINRLQTELEELQAKKNDINASVGGETMDIVVDIQIAELRCQLTEAQDVKDVFEKQLESSKRENIHLREQTERDNERLIQSKEINTHLSDALRSERDTIDKMKKWMENFESNYEDTKMKLENSLKEKETSAAESSTLRRKLDELEQQLQKYQQQMQSFWHFSNQISRDKGYESSACSPGETDPCNRDVAFTSEPNEYKFESNRFSQMSLDAGLKDMPRPSLIRDSKENRPEKSRREMSPMKGEDINHSDCASPPKQRRCRGTVVYFPLDPKGPIYPPPLPSKYPRRFLGRIIPSLQTTSSVTLQATDKCRSLYPCSGATTSMNICETRQTENTSKLKPVSSVQRKSVPTRHSSYRFFHTYKYTATKEAS